MPGEFDADLISSAWIVMLDRVSTGFDDHIYPPDWRAWCDPDIPEWIDPVETLLERHLTTATADKTAIVADGKSISYGGLVDLVRVYVAGLAAAGLAPDKRMLLFGTDRIIMMQDRRTFMEIECRRGVCRSDRGVRP